MARTIGLLFDPHVVADDRDGYDGIATVERAIDKLNEVGVDWTVIGGDLRHMLAPNNRVNETENITDWGGWHGEPGNYYYREDFERAKALFDERLEAGYFVIRGNNDRPLSVFREAFPADEFPAWFHLEDDGARYVFLDTNPHQGYHVLTEAQNFVSSPQIAMLERLMDEDSEVPTFVFAHAPLAKHTEVRDYHDDIHGNWEQGYMAAYYITLNHPVVQRVLERGNTVIVNSGHYHPDDGRGSIEVNGIEYVLARHLVHNMDPDYGGDVRWLEVDADARRAAVHYYDVGADETGTITERSW